MLLVENYKDMSMKSAGCKLNSKETLSWEKKTTRVTMEKSPKSKLHSRFDIN